MEEIKEALSAIDEEISVLQSRRALIESIDWTKPVDEDTWHEICETSLRGSPLLKTLVLNIFPDAEDIKIYANGVRFKLLGFDVEIPTSLARGIYVNISWYVHDSGEPVFEMHGYDKAMKEYFELKDKGAGWKELMRKRLYPDWNFRPFFLFCMWYGYYKWHQPDRKAWEKLFEVKRNAHQESVARYYEERRAMEEKKRVFVEELLPRLREFAPISEMDFRTGSFMYGSKHELIEEIRKFEEERENECFESKRKLQ